MSSKKVYIVILNYNGKQDTLECLETLFLAKKPNFLTQIIIVDNASTDGSVITIRKYFPKVKILKNKRNLGFASGNNVGIQYAIKNHADYVFILNNDTLVEKNCLSSLFKEGELDKNSGIIAPKIYFAPGFEFHKNRYQKADLGKVIWYAGGRIDWQNVLGIHFGVDKVDNGQFAQKKLIKFASGCAMFVKAVTFKKIGLFDPRYYLYLEDADFCTRAIKEGFKILYEPKAVLWHKNAQTAGGSGSSLQEYYYTRNRMLFGLRYASIKTRLALIKESLRFLVRGTKWRKIAIKDFYLQKFGPGSYR